MKTISTQNQETKVRLIESDCPKKGRKLTSLIAECKKQGFNEIRFLDTIITLKQNNMVVDEKTEDKELNVVPVKEHFFIRVYKNMYFQGIGRDLAETPKGFTKWTLNAIMDQIIQIYGEGNVAIKTCTN